MIMVIMIIIRIKTIVLKVKTRGLLHAQHPPFDFIDEQIQDYKGAKNYCREWVSSVTELERACFESGLFL